MSQDKKINIVLLSCVSQKTPFKNMAKDLYVSSLFKKSWQYSKEVIKPDGIYILSALYGLIRFDEVIEPYDKTLLNMSKEECQEWAEKVKTQLTERFVKDNRKLEDYNFIILAGSKYYENLSDFLPNKEFPLGRLPIGKRLGVLSSAIKTKKIIPVEIDSKEEKEN